MKRAPPGNKGTAANPKAVLRLRAEKIASEMPSVMAVNQDVLSVADAQRVLHDLQVHQIELEVQNEELRCAQDALEASRARYFDLYDLAPVGYFTLDENGCILEANLTGAKMLGVARATLVKQALSRFAVGDDADNCYLQLKQLFRTGAPHAFELRMAGKDGAPFTAWIEAVVAADDGGAPACRLVISDISERKKAELAHASLEAQLRESQKMEAIGTLAGGIAHDFNNILATILGNAELARQDARANWQALVSLEEIQKAGNRARDLVQQILSFSRRQPTSRRVILLPEVVEESVRLLRAALPGGVQIEHSCAADTPSILADPTQVQQVLLNLGTNAAHALEGRSGSIDICVEGITLEEAPARLQGNLRPGRYARIVVSDTGKGMDAATLQRIFEPFFTTKPPGKGTGLGLSVAHGIVQAHDGAIVVHSEPGKGSRFEVYFPHARVAAAVPGEAETAGPASEGRGRHILYIEDDEAQLFMLKRMLERWGYRVSACIEQREALDLLRAGEHFDLVVTDFNMPGISGMEAAREIRVSRPDLPVIMVSGYVTDALRAEAAAAGVRELIAKPCDLEELRDMVQRLVMKPIN